MKGTVPLRTRYALLLLCSLSLCAGAGCSIITSYPGEMRHVQAAFLDGNFAAASEALEAMKPSGGDKLCHLFERGTVYHTMGNYKASNRAFLEAVRIARAFDERAMVSVRDSTAYAAALVINDKTLPYRGSSFERVLLHTYLATNFLMQRDLEGARVEILRAYALQKTLHEQHGKSIQRTKSEAAGRQLDAGAIAQKVRNQYADQRALLKKAGNVYQNAFTYYLSALVYEMGGEIDDAYIDMKQVHGLNPNFLPAQRDLLRYSKDLGFRDDYREWQKKFGVEADEKLPSGHGEVVLVFQCGLAPEKEEIKFSFPIPIKNKAHLVSMAIPKYRSRYNPVSGVRLRVDGKMLGVTQALVDVEATAVRNLWDDAAEIAFRQVARAAGRIVAQQAARKEGGEWAALGVMIVGHLLEQADLRSWLTLPRELHILRADVPAGKHNFTMRLLPGGGGRVQLSNVPVRSGKITIINLRSVGNRGTANYVTF